MAAWFQELLGSVQKDGCGVSSQNIASIKHHAKQDRL